MPSLCWSDKGIHCFESSDEGQGIGVERREKECEHAVYLIFLSTSQCHRLRAILLYLPWQSKDLGLVLPHPFL